MTYPLLSGILLPSVSTQNKTGFAYSLIRKTSYLWYISELFRRTTYKARAPGEVMELAFSPIKMYVPDEADTAEILLRS